MSRNFAVLTKAGSPPFAGSRPGTTQQAAAFEPTSGSEEYDELIRRLFHGVAAVALVGSANPGEGKLKGVASVFAEGLASELANRGKRVVIVSVNSLLGVNPIKVPDEADFMPGPTPNVWVWPARAGQKIEFFKASESSAADTWLGYLRQNFDCVLLDSPHVDAGPAVAEIARLADATVLAVEASWTTRQQIQRDQHALQLQGVTVTGCVLIHRK